MIDFDLMELGFCGYLSLGCSCSSLESLGSCLEGLVLVWRPYLLLVDLELDGRPYLEGRVLESLPLPYLDFCWPPKTP